MPVPAQGGVTFQFPFWKWLFFMCLFVCPAELSLYDLRISKEVGDVGRTVPFRPKVDL